MLHFMIHSPCNSILEVQGNFKKSVFLLKGRISTFPPCEHLSANGRHNICCELVCFLIASLRTLMSVCWLFGLSVWQGTCLFLAGLELIIPGGSQLLNPLPGRSTAITKSPRKHAPIGTHLKIFRRTDLG